jgi:hypothetical protein
MNTYFNILEFTSKVQEKRQSQRCRRFSGRSTRNMAPYRCRVNRGKTPKILDVSLYVRVLPCYVIVQSKVGYSKWSPSLSFNVSENYFVIWTIN